MYKWGKPNQSAHNKCKNAHHGNDPKTPTLSSSSLPHQINNSLKTHFTKTEQQHQHPGAFQEHKMSSLRRACLVEKWVENKLTEKLVPRRRNPPTPTKRTLIEEFDLQDTLFFSSTKTEYSVFLHSKSKHGSAPSSPRPKPVRTRLVDNKDEVFEKTIPNSTRAQKIYSNLKNLKQPISPGARLSSFISSIFVKDGKRMKNNKKECKSENLSNCSSSFSKSCLSRSNSPTSKSSSKKKFSDGVKRTVRFCPSVSVILDEDDHDHDRRGVRKYNNGLERESEKMQKQRQIEEVALDLLNGYWDPKLSKSHGKNVNDDDYGVNHGTNYGQDEDNDDGLSCSSSDLFELDNLSLIRDELPVYETTQFDPTFL